MSVNTSDHDARNWKKQYYDHLDLLDRKEKDWQALESILKKTVLRLSITAEGQHARIDQHLQEIRGVVKKQVNVVRLENILEDISAIMLRISDKQAPADKKITATLVQLVEAIEFPDAVTKQKNKLIKKLTKTSDKDSEDLIDELKRLLSGSIKQNAESNQEQTKSGFLTGLFKSRDSTDAAVSIDNNPQKGAETALRKPVDSSEYETLIHDIGRFVEALPWPSSLSKDIKKELAKRSVNNTRGITEKLAGLAELVTKWKQQVEVEQSHNVDIDHKSDTISQPMTQAVQQPGNHAVSTNLTSASKPLSGEQPSAQETLIVLLEQLVVPADLHEIVEDLKRRIAVQSSEQSWKQLLKDIAQLINTLRSRMQEEKQEFETFLQEITGRLQEMDGFLSIENASLQEAELAGGVFDAAVNAQVQDIHDDMNTADNLQDLKGKVEKRLSVVSDHIKQYRVDEQQRFHSAQKNVESMQSRLAVLEQESGDLRQLIIEKNKEAMFDVLTEIPNRLSYEKKAVEEIARCKRFATAMTMAVWDIDLFKQVNDNYGHKVGDKVLKAVAQLLNARMRETDFIARYGGEEFVMFLSGADEEVALELVNKLREKISVCHFKHAGGIVRITVSCGITGFIEGDTHGSMFERADRALYAAKADGRNKCIAASSLDE